MAKESVADKLARLKASASYDLAPELRYDEPAEGPGTSEGERDSEDCPIPEVPLVEALRLPEPDLVRELDWIVECRERGIVPALKVLSGKNYRLHVYPRLERRFTLAARIGFREAGASSDGLVAFATTSDETKSEKLLNRMVEVTRLDESDERLLKALSVSPQDWLHEMRGVGAEWLSDSSDNLPEGPIGMGWSDYYGPPADNLSWRDLEIYQAYLGNKPLSKIAPSTCVNEDLRVYRERKGSLYRTYQERNRSSLSLFCTQLEPFIAAEKWQGWDEFHKRCPEASGILLLSAIGYSENYQTAFFSVFNRCDPRLLTRLNEEAGVTEYVERVWVEVSAEGWKLKESIRLHARPMDIGPMEARYTLPPARGVESVHPADKGTWQVFRPALLQPIETQVRITENEIQYGSETIMSEELEQLRVIDNSTVECLVSGSPIIFVFEDVLHVAKEFVRSIEWAGAFASRAKDGTLRILKETDARTAKADSLKPKSLILGFTTRRSSAMPSTNAAISVSVKRPPMLKDLVLEVVCKSESEFDVGLEDGQPMAFFILNEEHKTVSLSTAINRDGSQAALQPPELDRVNELRFELTADSFAPLGNEQLLTDSDPKEFIKVEIVVWIDGAWRVKRVALAPLESSERPSFADSYSLHSQSSLEALYQLRMGKEK